MKNNKAFTLVELMVVVIIIATLATIALPKYKRTLEKTRAIEAVVMVKAIADANKRFYSANEDYTYKLEELDVTIPGKDTSYGNMKRKKGKFFQFGARATSAEADERVIAIANRLVDNKPDTMYSLRVFADKAGIYCRYYPGKKYSEIGKATCQALSGSQNPHTTSGTEFWIIK